MATPRILEPFDTVRCKDNVEVERAVLELHEILAAQNLGRLLVRECKAQFAQGRHQGPTILESLFHKKIGILSRVGKSKKNRAGFADEQVSDPVLSEPVSNLQRLAVFKRGHNPTNQANSLRTSAGNPLWSQMPEKERRPAPVCKF